MTTEDALLSLVGDSVNIAIGPLVWRQKGAAKEWYFNIASGETEFHADQIVVAGTVEDGEAARAFCMGVFAVKRAVVIHTFDDEFEMVRWCVEIWPCDKTRALLRTVERETRKG